MKNVLFCLLVFPFTLFCADTWTRAEIEFSDGKHLSGYMLPLTSRPLLLNTDPNARSIPRKYQLKDLLSITQTVEKSSMGSPWMYRESGKNERIRLEGKEYPLFDFKTQIVSVNGESLTGHVVAFPFRFKTDLKSKKSGKYFLYRHYKGKPGEKLADIVRLVRITFPDHVPVKGQGICGKVSGLGKLQKVSALDPERKVCYEGAVNAKENSFSFPVLLPGKYELYVMTDKFVLAGFSGNEPVPDALEKNFRLADDFFPDRRIVKLGKERILVYKHRRDFVNKRRHVKGGYVWHLEVWNWHRAEEEWKLDTRNIVLRIKQQGKDFPRNFYAALDLSSVEPGKIFLRIGKEMLSEDLKIAFPEKTK